MSNGARAVIATDAWPISVDTALMSAPFSINEVANVRRPNDSTSDPDRPRYMRLNTTCVVFGVKPPPFLDLKTYRYTHLFSFSFIRARNGDVHRALPKI